MNLILFQLIVLALAASLEWDCYKSKAFLARIQPFAYEEEISQEEIDFIIEEFDIPTFPSHES